MPTKQRQARADARKARKAAGQLVTGPGEPLLPGALAHLNITPDVLQAFPKLLDKTSPLRPDSDWADVVSWYYDEARDLMVYRVRTVSDVARQGETAYPSASLTLSEIRAQYVALPA